eukprot:scaffold1307_cov200-Pinguiococcus_pyrenoidosus.AAC.156
MVGKPLADCTEYLDTSHSTACYQFQPFPFFPFWRTPLAAYSVPSDSLFPSFTRPVIAATWPARANQRAPSLLPSCPTAAEGVPSSASNGKATAWPELPAAQILPLEAFSLRRRWTCTKMRVLLSLALLAGCAAWKKPSAALSKGLQQCAGAVCLATVSLAGALPAEASYRLYQASEDDYKRAVREGTLRVERKPVYDDPKKVAEDPWADRKKELKARALAKQGASQSDGKAGRYCAGDYFYVSPLYENACDRIGLAKADQNTDRRDEFQSYMR